MIRPTASALCLVLLAGPTLAEVAVTDGAGRELTFATPPERVVALYNDAFGQMATLGVRPVATLVNPEMAADAAYYFDDGASIPLVANMDGTPDPEIIASFMPDLIVTWSAEEAASFEGIAPVFVMHDGGPEEVRRNLVDLGTILGASDRAEAELAAFDARVAAYAARVPEQPTVLKLGASNADSFWIGSAGDPACGLLDMVVTCNWPGETPESWSYEATTEAVLALDPDVIVLGNWSEMDDAGLQAALEANPLWGEIRAVKEGRVVTVPGYSNPIFSSIAAGNKLIDTLIPAIFPEAFPNGALTEAEVIAEVSQ